MKIRSSLCSFFLLSLSLTIGLLPVQKAFGQELQATVTVNAQNIQLSDRGIFDDMARAMENFLNTRRWTNEIWQPQERIKCNFALTMESMPNVGSFTGSMQVQVLRPVYGASYETIIFNFADRNWQFDYVESLPLDFNENTFQTNLTSMLGFYALLILGLDADSFSPLGGSPYFDRAFNVVLNAQQSPRTGWKQFESNRNRYWLIENLMSPQMAPVREANYLYHRQGMDNFGRDDNLAREAILDAIRKIREVNRLRPNQVLVNTFFDAKSEELANIFARGNAQVREEAIRLLSELDPGNIERYNRSNQR
jgi:hypothetical protein